VCGFRFLLKEDSPGVIVQVFMPPAGIALQRFEGVIGNGEIVVVLDVAGGSETGRNH